MAMYRLVSSVKVQKVRAFGTLGKPNTDVLDNGHSNWQNTLVITGAEYMTCIASQSQQRVFLITTLPMQGDCKPKRSTG